MSNTDPNANADLLAQQATADAAASEAAAAAAAAAAGDSPAAKPASGKTAVKARVLTPCQFGAVNSVVTLSATQAKAAERDGLVDTAPAAVAYAESLAND